MPTYGYLSIEGWEHARVSYNNSIKDHFGAPEEDYFLAQTDVVRSGDYAVKFMPTDDFGAAFAPVSWSGEASGSVRMYFRFESFPVAGKAEVGFFEWNNQGATRLTTKVYYDTADGRLHLHHSTDEAAPLDDYDFAYPLDYESGSMVDGPAVARGYWHRLDMRWVYWDGHRRTDWSVDGVEFPSITETSPNVDEFENVLFFWIGCASTNECVLYVDDLAQTGNWLEESIPPDPRPDPLYPIGPGFILAYRPNACGTHNDPSNRLQEDDGSALDANTWNRLDDVPPNQPPSWDGIKQIAIDVAAYAEFLFEDCTEPWPITAIDPVKCTHVGAGGGGFGYLQLRLEYDGEEYPQGGGAPLELRQTDIFYEPANLGIDGYGGDSTIFRGPADLTAEKFNALAIRAGYSNDVTPVPALDGLLIHVAFDTTTSVRRGADPGIDEILGTPAHVVTNRKGQSL